MKKSWTLPKLKGFDLPSNLIFSDNKTVCVKHKDGTVTEHPNITNPWIYINSLKNIPDVEFAWIKNK